MAKRQKIKKVFNLFIYWLLYFILIILAIYSYSLVDLNLTFFKSQFWEDFRNAVIQLGYFKRNYSTIIYLLLISFLTFFNLVFLKIKINPIKVALTTGIVCLFAYPFLSHDFFNYLFDAKILTYYHQNPYLHKALDFPKDSWLRFMHWTHRSYPYGPVFLLISLVPSFLALGKFILNFLFFKLMFILFYLMAVYCLNKMNKKWALLFATHPLVIIEGLISPHNDLIGVSLAIVGIYYLLSNKHVIARLFLILSGGIKYLTLPLIFLNLPRVSHPEFISGSIKRFRNKFGMTQKTDFNKIVLFGQIVILVYLSVKSEIQPWYFLSLFAFLPFYEELILKLNIFFAGLLFSYYPYVRFGGWDSVEKVNIKHQIIIAFFILNVAVFLIKTLKNKTFSLRFPPSF
jgi:hypothetical protein